MDQLKKTVLKEYQFKSLQNLTYHLNRMIDVANITNRRPRGTHPNDPYPWLDPNDPHYSLTDEQILDQNHRSFCQLSLLHGEKKANDLVEMSQESV